MDFPRVDRFEQFDSFARLSTLEHERGPPLCDIGGTEIHAAKAAIFGIGA